MIYIFLPDFFSINLLKKNKIKETLLWQVKLNVRWFGFFSKWQIHKYLKCDAAFF